MATGSTDATTTEEADSDALASLLDGDEPITIIAYPAPRQILAAATIVQESDAPVHLRVIGPSRPPIETDPESTIATATGLVEAEVSLSPYTPLADVEAIGGNRSGLLADAIEAVRSVGSDPVPGIVATHADLEEALDRSIRLSIKEDAQLPSPGSLHDRSADERRSISSWLVASVLASEDVGSVNNALQSALAPTFCEAGPAPTAEGSVDILSTVAEQEPGRVLASLIGGESWDGLVEGYETIVEPLESVVQSLPRGTGNEIITAEVESDPTIATARLWAGTNLEASYGVIIAGDEPTQMTLVANGERSASAVLETVANRREGTSWGDPFVATAILPERPEAPTQMIERAL